jgi:type VI protein secretion system component VasK
VSSPTQSTQLSWRRYVVALLIVVLCVAAGAVLNLLRRGSVNIGFTTVVVVFLAGYFTYAWRRAKRLLDSGVVSPEEFRADPKRYLKGSSLETFIAVFILIVAMTIYALYDAHII